MGRLGHSGPTNGLRRELFPSSFPGEVMQIIVNTWESLSLPRAVNHETNITALFRQALIKAYAAAGRSWFVTLEDPITDAECGTQTGRNDLRFYPPQHAGQTVFFSVECKRLRVQTDSGLKHLADEYTNEGILRFVNGRYAAGLPCGGMVGYVMDNQTHLALQTVLDMIKKQYKALCLKSGRDIKVPSAVLTNCPCSIDTHHSRTDGTFKLHHVMLGVRR